MQNPREKRTLSNFLLEIINILLTKSYKVLAYANKGSLQLHWCADSLEFKLCPHSVVIQL